jgi:maltooligosyltrehalose trehalohydrolase
MLFQGQEYGASTPFLYFADHNKDLARMVQRGRAEFLTQFPSIAGLPSMSALAIPDDRSTFEQCKLHHDELRANEHYLALHKDLLKLRRDDPVIRAQRSDWIHGAVLSADAFALRFFGGEHGDRLLLINLGSDLRLQPVPEPLLAPPAGAWDMVWCSNDLRYGGSGGCLLPDSGAGVLSAQTAVLMSAKPQREIIRSDKAYERRIGD